MPLVIWLCRRVIAFATTPSPPGATDQPIRQPVIAIDLLSPFRVTVRSARAGSEPGLNADAEGSISG